MLFKKLKRLGSFEVYIEDLPLWKLTSLLTEVARSYGPHWKAQCPLSVLGLQNPRNGGAQRGDLSLE